MKRIIVFIVSAIIAINIQSQSPADKVFDKYSGMEGFTTVYITKYMFDLFKDVENGEVSDEMQEAISRLNSIKILASDDDPGTKTSINLYNEVMKNLPKEEYKELMVIKEKDEKVEFLIREKNKKIIELLLLVDSPDESVMISIQGDNIDMKNIGKITKSMNIEGMEKLDNME
ncbi:MAG: DUF4252 domain-containing protein [Bacteroidales bacterium]|nr:MAG: DUF4252 domain-containing protein [Bacteroidales bacterium]